MPTAKAVFLRRTFYARAIDQLHVIATTDDAFEFIARVKPRGLVWSVTWNCLCHAERDPASYGVDTASMGLEEALRADGMYLGSVPSHRSMLN
jgi:hypothetical protein